MIQENEVIKFKLKDYITGSFVSYGFDLSLTGTNTPLNETAKIFDIRDPYHLIIGGKFYSNDYGAPLRDTTHLLIVHEKNSIERVFIFLIDEGYVALITDFTEDEFLVANVVLKLDLKPYISSYLGKFDMNLVRCNSLVTVEKATTYFLP